MDFQKAYDVVPRQKLIEVLKVNGCGKLMLQIIQAMYKCTKSILKAAVITTSPGIKQGSPSSCYLFIIYINDLYNATDKFKPVLFADDTNLASTLCAFTRVFRNDDDLSNNINIELDKIYIWLCANKLSLNANKTKYMVFHYRQQQKYSRITTQI